MKGTVVGFYQTLPEVWRQRQARNIRDGTIVPSYLYERHMEEPHAIKNDMSVLVSTLIELKRYLF